jgi:hypothetical protein
LREDEDKWTKVAQASSSPTSTVRLMATATAASPRAHDGGGHDHHDH